MNSNDSIMALVAGYETYMDASDLDVTAVADAPATTWYCASAAVSFLSAATYEATC
ncbi:LxmA leader domain family RiPP [Streptomyces virginiae]